MSYIADIIDAFETKVTNREVLLAAGMNTQITVKGIVYRLTSKNGSIIRVYEGERLIARILYTPTGGILYRMEGTNELVRVKEDEFEYDFGSSNTALQAGGYRKRRGRRSTRRRANKRRSTRRNK